jgi:hypothetical protein
MQPPVCCKVDSQNLVVRCRPKASNLHVTMSNLIPFPNNKPEGYLKQVAHAVRMVDGCCLS